jgi:ribonuclease HI
LNTDGASKGNPGPSGGGVIRNDKGDVIFAFSHYYGETDSLIAEVRAALDGLRYCFARSLFVNSIESDSAILVKVLNEGSAMPWKVARWIAEIRNLLFIMKPSIAHVVREANQPADKLANYGVLTMENGFYSSWAELPTEARGPNGQATSPVFVFKFPYVVFPFYDYLMETMDAISL